MGIFSALFTPNKTEKALTQENLFLIEKISSTFSQIYLWKEEKEL